MNFTAILALLLVAFTVAQQPPIQYRGPYRGTTPGLSPRPGNFNQKPQYDYDPHATYKFGYTVNDPERGDFHSQTEERENGVVKGQYQLIETDGSLRTVTYTADPINGFRAVVDRGALPVRELQNYPHLHQ